jgi:hypothetical protein
MVIRNEFSCLWSIPDHQHGIICGVAFKRSALRRIAAYGSALAPRRLASNTLLAIRESELF